MGRTRVVVMSESQRTNPGMPSKFVPSGDKGSASGRETARPRAFVTATGLVAQVFGGVLVFGSCAVWAVSALTPTSSGAPAARWMDHLTGPRETMALVTLGLFGGLVGGLGLLAAGVGMQGEKKGSASFGAAAGIVLTMLYFGLAAALVYSAGRWLLGAAALLLGLCAGAAALLCLISHRTLKQFPPTEDYNLLTAEILEELRRRREERRKEYDL